MPDFENDFFRGFKTLSDEMELLLNDFLKRPLLMAQTRVWKPATDVYETEEEYVVRMDIAGIRPEDVYIAYEAGIVTIRGVRRERLAHQKRYYHKMEIDFGPFERRIEIPLSIDQANVKAAYQDGFLEVRLKKATERRARSVTIVIE